MRIQGGRTRHAQFCLLLLRGGGCKCIIAYTHILSLKSTYNVYNTYLTLCCRYKNIGFVWMDIKTIPERKNSTAILDPPLIFSWLCNTSLDRVSCIVHLQALFKLVLVYYLSNKACCFALFLLFIVFWMK